MAKSNRVFVEGKYRTLGNKKGSLSLKLTTGKDWQTGAQIQHEYTGKTAEQVLESVERSRGYSDEELGLSEESITVSQLMEEWLDYKDTSVSEERICDLRRRINSDILKFIGDVPVRELNVEKLEDWILELDDNNFPVRRIKLAINFLNSALEIGIVNKRIVTNPCRELKRIENVIQNQTILNEDQIKKILVTEKDHLYMPAYALMLGTGMRISEALGLSLEQIDFERREITVSQQLLPNRIKVGPTKTRKQRKFPVSDWVMKIIEIAIARQENFKATNPNFSNELNLLLCRKNGKPLSQPKVSKKFREMMSDTSCPNVSCHSLRRTFASFGAEMGYIMGVKHVLGHSDISTTIRYIYAVQGDAMQLVQNMNEHYEPLIREIISEENFERGI